MKVSALCPCGEGVVVGWCAWAILAVTLESGLSEIVAVARSWEAAEVDPLVDFMRGPVTLVCSSVASGGRLQACGRW